MLQKTSLCRILLTLFCLLFCGFTHSSAEPDWSKVRLKIYPGIKAGGLELGRQIPETSLKFLGPAQTTTPTKKYGDYRQLYIWGSSEKDRLTKGLKVLTLDGTSESPIGLVECRQIRAITDKGVYIGSTLEQAQKKYPDLQWDKGKGYIPGLTFLTSAQKITGFQLHSDQLYRWRFHQLVISPGHSVDELKLRQVQKVQKSLGPHKRTHATSGEKIDLYGTSQHFVKVISDTRGLTSLIEVFGRPAQTKQGLSYRDPVKKLLKLYPNARKGQDFSQKMDYYDISGLRIFISQGLVEGFRVFPSSGSQL